MIKYLSQINIKKLKDKTCLLRLDFNTEDAWRLEACLPTIQFLLKNCKKIVILGHKGRPENQELSLSLKPVTETLNKITKKQVIFIPHFRFSEIKKEIDLAPLKSIILLENLRFLKGENKNSLSLAKSLASLGNIYINDAFAVSHRANASICTITKFIKSYAGLELEKEIKSLQKAIKNPVKPLVIIIGGGKIKDKLKIYKSLKNKSSAFLVAGAVNDKMLVQKIPKVYFPIDAIRENGVIRDIGSKTIDLFKEKISTAKTIIWNGPLGIIEKNEFQKGTLEIAKSVINNKQAHKIIGGGEIISFLKKNKLDKKISASSTGVGAMLEFLAGKIMPGIKALNG